MSRKYAGSCGIYVFVKAASRNGGSLEWHVLVHRRSVHVVDSGKLAAPGGRVERSLCGGSSGGNFDFGLGARKAALKELEEEAGLVLDAADASQLRELQAEASKDRHINFSVELPAIPNIPGPGAGFLNEVERGGVDGVGRPAGDGFHAWVSVEALLGRSDLLPACRVPLQHFLKEHGSQSEVGFTHEFRFEEGTQSLGFEVAWPTGDLPEIKTVKPDGAGLHHGVLQGDRIVACNGTPVEGKQRQEVLPLLRLRPLMLRVFRKPFRHSPIYDTGATGESMAVSGPEQSVKTGDTEVAGAEEHHSGAQQAPHAESPTVNAPLDLPALVGDWSDAKGSWYEVYLSHGSQEACDVRTTRRSGEKKTTPRLIRIVGDTITFGKDFVLDDSSSSTRIRWVLRPGAPRKNQNEYIWSREGPPPKLPTVNGWKHSQGTNGARAVEPPELQPTSTWLCELCGFRNKQKNQICGGIPNGPVGCKAPFSIARIGGGGTYASGDGQSVYYRSRSNDSGNVCDVRDAESDNKLAASTPTQNGPSLGSFDSDADGGDAANSDDSGEEHASKRTRLNDEESPGGLIQSLLLCS